MARGKQTCRILKDIRRRIAEANDIEFVTSECRYRGDCPGTCPKCEAEVRYLEEQLASRRLAGKAVILAGLTVLSACGNPSATAPAAESVVESVPDTALCCTEELEGEVVEGEVDCEVEEPIEVVTQAEITELLIVGEVEETEDISFSDTIDTNDEAIDITVGTGYVSDVKPVYDNVYDIATVDYKPDVDAINCSIRENLQYPEAALTEGAEGRVLVEIVVDSTGTISKKRLVRPLHPALDKEALRLISMVPTVRPARLGDGRAVDCLFSVVVTFRVPEDSKEPEHKIFK